MNNYFKNRKMQVRFSSDIEPHEIIIDKLVRKKEERWGFQDMKIKIPLLERTVYFFLVFSVLIILSLFIRTFQLQVVEGEGFLALANDNRYISSKIHAERGIIYDQNMKQLVFNAPSFNLTCQKNNLPKSETEAQRILNEVSEVLNLEKGELDKRIKESQDLSILISENLDYQTVIILETKLGQWPGFEIEQVLIRDYVDGDYFSHLLGYMGKIKSEELKENREYYSISDYVGRTGVETYYEDVLRKNPGQVMIERDALGNIISKEIVSLPQSGNSLVLWLDSDLQKKIRDELEKEMELIGSHKATAVALNPKTGGVLAMVSIPSFDNNIFSGKDPEELQKVLQDVQKPLFNRAIGGIGYPTGSTIKPLVALAALQENIISANRAINCQGVITVENQYDPEIIYQYHDWSIHGLTDMRKAIAESCNVYFYSIGGGNEDLNITGLGAAIIKKNLSLFGWSEKTGIDLPEEGQGILPVIDKNWTLGNTYHLSIGQGAFTITPLQVANAYAAIANNGRLLKPHVLKQIIETAADSSETIKEIEPEIISQGFVDLDNLQVVREGMRQAVTGKGSPLASAILLNSLPEPVAAKTGTAETSKDGIYHNWVNVFGPYNDPEIVLTIMIEDVEGVRAAAVPVAREVLDWYFSR